MVSLVFNLVLVKWQVRADLRVCGQVGDHPPVLGLSKTRTYKVKCIKMTLDQYFIYK